MLPEGERGVAGVERKDAISQLDAKISDRYRNDLMGYGTVFIVWSEALIRTLCLYVCL